MSVALIPAMMKTAFTAMATYAAPIQASLAVASAGSSYLAGQGQADALEAANAQANEQALANLTEDYDQVGKMAIQERAAASQRQQQNSVNGQRARAQVKAAAGESGVSGLSIDALLGDLYGQEASVRDSINQNLEGTVDQLSMERRGLQRNVRNQMASRPIPQRPSLIGTAFQGASGVFDAYRDRFKIGE